MRTSQQNDRYRHKLKAIGTTAKRFQNNLRSIEDCWLKQLVILESSLETMRDELFYPSDRQEVSVTGQILIENVAERVSKIIAGATEQHRTLHIPLSKIGKFVSRHFDPDMFTPFYNSLDLELNQKRRHLSFTLIYDYAMCTGLNTFGDSMKKHSDIQEEYDVREPDILQQIVLDLREGDIQSSLEFLETHQPDDERTLRKSLQTQMITDSIELGVDSYDRTVRQLRRFSSPNREDRKKATRLVGALLVGKTSVEDDRYKSLFDYASREKLVLKMSSFFIPYEAPLKNLLRFGYKGMNQMTELCLLGYEGSCCLMECELPIDTVFTGNHSVFSCPILKEQCTMQNPPMRLLCGHVISREAIARLMSNHRHARNMPRHARQIRFKCPYCPREQVVENAKPVDFRGWVHQSHLESELNFLEFYD